MKKILSLVLALCLICLSVSALAEIPSSVEDLPAAVTDVEIEDFFGVWQAGYAVYDDEMATLEDVAPMFGGFLPVVAIDEEKITATFGEDGNETVESYEYVYDEEYAEILIFNETEDVILDIQIVETGALKVLFIDAMVELYMLKVEEG